MPIHSGGKCGRISGINYTCSSTNPCCSQYGWCGNSTAHCNNKQTTYSYTAPAATPAYTAPAATPAYTAPAAPASCVVSAGNWGNLTSQTGAIINSSDSWELRNGASRSRAMYNNGSASCTPAQRQTTETQTNCITSNGPWSNCNTYPGDACNSSGYRNGYKTRTISLVTPAVNGGDCITTGNYTQYNYDCTEQCPVNCVTSYDNWSSCTPNVPCDGKSSSTPGTQTRNYSIITKEINEGKCDIAPTSQACVAQCQLNAVNCTGNWNNNWTECIATSACNGINPYTPGTQSRTFAVITPANSYGTCPGPQTQTCEIPCAQNRSTKPNDASSSVRCGKNYNNQKCPNSNDCCSGDGWCGKGINFCNLYTQPNFCGNRDLFGNASELAYHKDRCVAGPTPVDVPTIKPNGTTNQQQCGKDANGSYVNKSGDLYGRCTGANECCSGWSGTKYYGWCGTDSSYCYSDAQKGDPNLGEQASFYCGPCDGNSYSGCKTWASGICS